MTCTKLSNRITHSITRKVAPRRRGGCAASRPRIRSKETTIEPINAVYNPFLRSESFEIRPMSCTPKTEEILDHDTLMPENFNSMVISNTKTSATPLRTETNVVKLEDDPESTSLFLSGQDSLQAYQGFRKGSSYLVGNPSNLNSIACILGANDSQYESVKFLKNEEDYYEWDDSEREGGRNNLREVGDDYKY
jgi:hypothetical protein